MTVASKLTLPLACAALLFAAGAVPAQAPAQAPARCASPAYHAFDFWIGEWNVTSGDKAAGTNTIRSMLGGCALHESWRSASGGLGESLTMYDAGSDRWRQLWTDTDGDVLSLAGNGTSAGMELEGVRTDATSGERTRERIRWTRNADGSVTQRWEFAAEAGGEWSLRFEGRYVRKTASVSGAAAAPP